GVQPSVSFPPTVRRQLLTPIPAATRRPTRLPRRRCPSVRRSRRPAQRCLLSDEPARGRRPSPPATSGIGRSLNRPGRRCPVPLRFGPVVEGERYPQGERLPRPGSSAPPQLVRRRLAGPHEPNFGRRSAGFQPRDRRVVISVDLVIAAVHVDGDELAVILRTERRPHAAVIDLRPPAAEFLQAKVPFSVWHGVPPGNCPDHNNCCRLRKIHSL